jgi:ribose 5-phosphate isomerase A
LSYDSAISALSNDALKFVKDGYVIGLGSGRAATVLVKSLALLIKEKKYNIIGVPTSLQIKLIAQE